MRGWDSPSQSVGIPLAQRGVETATETKLQQDRPVYDGVSRIRLSPATFDPLEPQSKKRHR